MSRNATNVKMFNYFKMRFKPSRGTSQKSHHNKTAQQLTQNPFRLEKFTKRQERQKWFLCRQ
jgi:hypothetical protein